MEKRALREKIADVDEKLEKMYGAKKQTKLRKPTEELILTVLSQNTNDVNRDRAFTSLTSRFTGWKEMADTRSSSIASAIKAGGLANIKSKRIKKILKQIGQRSEDYSLSFLNGMSDKEAWDYLISFDGVGPKTAACVMMFSLGKSVMPVDTHVHRVSTRLGLIPKGMNAEKAHDWYRELEPPVNVYQFHLNLIAHGRSLCRPAKPRCLDCNLRKQCHFFRETLS